MVRDGYPRPFIASVVGAAAATDILIPPSIAFIIYAVMTPGVSVPAIFAAGMFPGILAGLMMLIPIVTISILKDFGGKTVGEERPKLWQSFKEAFWGLLAPVIILGGMRIGAFTPTEAAVMAVFYGLFVGMVVYRTIKVRDLFLILREGAEISAVILMVVALAGIFAYSLALSPQIAALGSYVLIPENLHEPLRQRMGLMKGAGATARAFYDYLQEPAARAVFKRYGFVLPGES